MSTHHPRTCGTKGCCPSQQGFHLPLTPKFPQRLQAVAVLSAPSHAQEPTFTHGATSPKRTPTPRELWRSFHRLVAPPSGPSPPLMHFSEGLAQRTVFARLHTGLPGEANLQGFSYNTDPTGEPTREIADAVGAPGLIQGKAQHQASSHGRRRLCLNVATGILPKNTILWSS